MNGRDIIRVYEDSPVHLYVHIPYCIKKCEFCYYQSFDLHDKQIPEEYFNALLKEIKLYSDRFHRIRSVYWGGGTPTMMDERQIERLCQTIFSTFKPTDDLEFCVEVRPGAETSVDKIHRLKDFSVRRISMGCQSMNDVILRANGRNHRRNAFLKTFNMLRDEEIHTINVDMMSGLLGDTEETFMESIEEVSALHPENITLYKMQLYYNSHLYRKIRRENTPLMTDDEEIVCARRAYEFLLNSGYELADNFSFRTGPEHEHIFRTATWRGEDMVGIGLSAHSCVNRVIYQNEPDLEAYYKSINEGVLPIKRAYVYSPYEAMVRHFIFGIKRTCYDVRDFYRNFGVDLERIFGKEIDELAIGEFIEREDNFIRTTLKGTLFADDIVRAVFPNTQSTIKMGFLERS
jgi:oxygen-independent coproporphyrinogen-3 oxidase